MTLKFPLTIRIADNNSTMVINNVSEFPTNRIFTIIDTPVSLNDRIREFASDYDGGMLKAKNITDDIFENAGTNGSPVRLFVINAIRAAFKAGRNSVNRGE